MTKRTPKKITVREPGYTPRRRAVTRTPELEQVILERVAAGESLRQACRGEGMPDEATIRYWAVSDPADFGARLTAARVCQAHEWFDLIRDELARPPVKTADGKTDHGEVALRRLRCDMWRWGLSKLLPANFGDRVALEHSGGIHISVVTGVPRNEASPGA